LATRPRPASTPSASSSAGTRSRRSRARPTGAASTSPTPTRRTTATSGRDFRATARRAAAATPPTSAWPRPRALPLRRDKESAYRDFVGKVAARYGDVAYAFELWNEPDLAACRHWAGTREQYKAQILSAATVVKQSGAVPGLVVAPTLEEPS
jgi:hypothetical protein